MNAQSGEWPAIVAALVSVARWQIRQGRGDVLPFRDVVDLADAPEALASELRYLHSVTYRDIVGTLGPPSVRQVLRRMWEEADERSRDIASTRIFADQPETLRTVGARLGLSAERVRQLEQRIRAEIAAAVEPDGQLGWLTNSVITECTPVRRVSSVLEHFPVLTEEVPFLKVTFWRLLTVACSSLEVKDGWIGAPSVGVAREATIRGVRELEQSSGVTPFERLRPFVSHYPENGLIAWLRYCGFGILGDSIIDIEGTTSDVLVRLLREAGEPLSRQQLEERINHLELDRAGATLAASLSRDLRTTRLGKGLWGLTEWGHVEYVSIRGLIGNLVGPGDEVPLDDVIAASAGRRVAEESVRRFADCFPFETVDGMVRRTTPSTPVATPADHASLLYRLDGGWVIPIDLLPAHLAAGRMPLLTGLASARNLRFGESQILAEGVELKWTGTLPVIEGIGGHLARHNAGDRVFLWFGDEGGFDVRPTRPQTPHEPPGLRRALQLIGLPDAPDDDARWSALAVAGGLDPAAEPGKIIAAYDRKREREVFEELLTALGGVGTPILDPDY